MQNFDKLSCVLFDLDGTLVDTAPDFIAVIQQLCADQGVEPPTDKAVLATVSSGARALVELSFHLQPGADGFDALHMSLLRLYGEQLIESQAQLYAGMEELLSSLESARIPWGIVTNKPERYSMALLKALRLERRCAVLVCPDHVSQTKPDPEPLLLACDRLACAIQEGVYIGDHPRDIEAGKAAGMYTIAAAYGYLPPTPPIDSWNADHIAHSVTDIHQLLLTRR